MKRWRDDWQGSRVLPALATAYAGWLLSGEPAFAQTLGGGEAIEIPFLRIFAGLILAVLIALGAALLLKRKAGGRLDLAQLLTRQLPGRTSRQIRIHETHRLSPHADLCRFTSGNKEYVVILSPNAAHVLSVSDAQPADASAANQAVR